MTNDSGAGFYLWVDPSREAGYNPRTFDQAAFLSRAVALFQAKAKWGGRRPQTVIAHPDQAENGLQPVARSLGLQVVSDPAVTAGTYRLGLSMAIGKEGE